ncbi:MAG: histidinol-phosphatase [candidate division WOR-3 bacterium]|nr:histidinol-phosphatase [candidate division WOR-3 bacterium]
MIDLHVHTSFSPDSNIAPERACRAAVARGLKIIGFADHVEFLPEDGAYVDLINPEKILTEIERLRERYRGKLEILFGAEIGYIPGKEGRIKDFLDSQPLDYAVGSVHYVDGVLVSRWVRERELAGKSFMPYFENVLAAAESGLFDVLGHLDYIRKYLFAPQKYVREEYEGMVDRILESAAREGLIIELNTSGWRHATGEPYPGGKILKRFAELSRGLTGGVTGVTGVTVGSDAHKYYEVGYAAGQARDLLRRAGFGSVEVLRQRKRFALPL